MPGYGARYWAERTPDARRPKHSAWRGDGTADVVIIGGGLTGSTTAYVLAKAGLDVVLLEANRTASGATASGPGMILPEPAVSFRAAEAAAGLRRTKAAWHAARDSALDMAAALRRLTIRCDLEPAPLLATAFRDDGELPLKRELASRRAGGVEASWLTPRAVATALAIDTKGAIRQKGAFVFDPVRAALGMIRAAEAAGARIAERSTVRRTTFTRKSADVILATGRIRTRGIVVATGTPGGLFRPLVRHVRQAEAYAVVTEPLTPHMKRATGPHDSVVVETGDSPRLIRWLADGRALFAGAESTPAGPRNLPKVLVQRTGQLMYELSLRYPAISGLPARWGWPVPVVTAPDGLPWIGVHRNYPFHFFAVAQGWHGDGLAWYSAKAALRHFRGEPTKGDYIFEFGR